MAILQDSLLVLVCVCVKGCKSPMVVKFADTQRDKELRRLRTERFPSSNAAPGLLGMQVAAVSHRTMYHKKVKVKFSHTRYRALGPELIPVYRQSARR